MNPEVKKFTCFQIIWYLVGVHLIWIENPMIWETKKNRKDEMAGFDLLSEQESDSKRNRRKCLKVEFSELML